MWVQETASRRPATEMYVRRGIVFCAHKTVCVCVCLVVYTYTTTLVTPRIGDRVVPRISAILHPRTQLAARCWPINTAGPTAWFHFHYQPRRYSCPAFLARKASRVIRAAEMSVCLVEQHAGRNTVLLRHLTTWQIGGGGGGRHNQPPPPPTGPFYRMKTQLIDFKL